jgi:hypothetical protein
VSRSERRQKIAAQHAALNWEGTSVLESTPNFLPTTLENSHSGYASLKTIATECSKRPAANQTL